MWSRSGGDKELRAGPVGRVGPRHGHDPWPVEQYLVGELVTYGIARPPAAIARRVAALGHKPLDHAVPGEAVVEAFSRQEYKVVDRLRRQVGSQLDLDVAARRSDGGQI